MSTKGKKIELYDETGAGLVSIGTRIMNGKRQVRWGGRLWYVCRSRDGQVWMLSTPVEAA